VVRRHRKQREAGFTLVEVMIALLLTVIAVVGIIGLYRVETRASSNSRHTTEASVLAEDKTEILRTTAISDGSETVDEQGLPGGIYLRSWQTIPTGGGYSDITVKVTWTEEGDATKIVIARSRKTI
jgi:type IV pilus assembly protein PilV